MSLLFRIIHAGKAKGTHNWLALDALLHLENDEAAKWRRLFLKHVDVYLEGSKAPDREFKDFKNHVLHVGDEFWGGAPDKARAWYEKFVRSLAEKQFEEAIYCAGVLSHYYTDPIQPFHTGQCEAENNMHRAVEWSISKSYKKLRKRGLKRREAIIVEAEPGADWLGDMVRRGAVRSHQYYDALISGYNLERGVVSPPDGLSEGCRAFLSELLVYASMGYARILDRAFIEAAISPPDVNLTLNTFLAGLTIPVHWILRKLEDGEEARAVKAAWDELRQTGRVEKNLSEDDRFIRDLHRREVSSRRVIAPTPREARRLRRHFSGQGNVRNELTEERLNASASISARAKAAPVKAEAAPINIAIAKAASAPDGERKAAATQARTPAPAARPAMLKPASVAAPATAPVIAAVSNDNQPSTPAASGETIATAKSKGSKKSKAPKAARKQEEKDRKATNRKDSAAAASRKRKRNPRYYLEPSDNIEKAPSIGRKTAARLEKIGVETVDDLLKADPRDISSAVNVKWITSCEVGKWQKQARLVCEVADLRGGHAQILVGAGIVSSRSLALLSGNELLSMMKLYCHGEGKNLRACERLPELERVEGWIRSVKENPRSVAA
jgi:hypothetical protein